MKKVFAAALTALITALVVISLDAVTIPKVAFTDARLKNGLRVIVTEDHTAPVVAVSLTYDVGSRNERRRRTGFAHLFEHMMFEGSANVADDEHGALIQNNGGEYNGTTNKDYTSYFERLPANQLDLALFLEADRMRSLEITQENLDNQRNAVQEERRLRVDNQPYGRTGEIVDELAYENFAYEHSVIGSMADLDAATVEEIAAFFKTYYAPNNAVLAIVGDVETKVAIEKTRKYFESIPSQPRPPPVDIGEPPQREERRRTIEDPLARLTAINIVYQMPAGLSADVDALGALASVLGSGRSSRFYEMLVRRKQLVVQAGTSAPPSRGPGLFEIFAVVGQGKSAVEAEAGIYEEIERVKNGQVEGWELEKARNAALRALVNSMGSSLQRANLLSRYAVFYNDPGYINTRYERLAAIRAEDLPRVARQYLVSTNRTVVITQPGSAGAGGAR